MTGEIVNLRRVRKQRARAASDATAAANRVAFGRTKSETSLAATERRRAEDRLEGHRLPGAPEPTDG